MSEIFCGIHNLLPNANCVLTIGNFDGLHLGHQSIIQTLQQLAKHNALLSCVLLFEPHPQEFFSGINAPARLMRLREKIKALRELKIDKIVCLPFNQNLAQMTAENFVKEILVARLGARILVIGDDFRFGKGRGGDLKLLKKMGKNYQFKVYTTPTVRFAGQRIGSSRVRIALKAGDFTLASHLLGRAFTLTGRVRYGDHRGQALGFPTANIALHRLVSPLQGVFIVHVYGLEKEPLQGVANCGKRPTVDGLKNLLEVHIFNFSHSIYGHWLEIEFLQKIREEQKFTSLEGLKNQIFNDIIAAKKFFSLNT